MSPSEEGTSPPLTVLVPYSFNMWISTVFLMNAYCSTIKSFCHQGWCAPISGNRSSCSLWGSLLTISGMSTCRGPKSLLFSCGEWSVCHYCYDSSSRVALSRTRTRNWNELSPHRAWVSLSTPTWAIPPLVSRKPPASAFFQFSRRVAREKSIFRAWKKVDCFSIIFKFVTAPPSPLPFRRNIINACRIHLGIATTLLQYRTEIESEFCTLHFSTIFFFLFFISEWRVCLTSS